jgi:LysR substrate binding domain
MTASIARSLYPAYALAVVSNTHKLARRPLLDVADLADLAHEPVMLLRGGLASHDWFKAACRVARFRPRVLLESGAPQTTTVQIPQRCVRAMALVQRDAAVGPWLRIAWIRDGFSHHTRNDSLMGWYSTVRAFFRVEISRETSHEFRGKYRISN